MDQQKIDQLFREKLDSHEVTPSDQAWLEVEKRIGPSKSSTKFYWIAAAVSAILITWVVWPEQRMENFTPIASEVNHPELNTDFIFEWAIPDIKKERIKDVEPKIEKPGAVQLVAEEPTKNPIKDVVDETILEEAPVFKIDTETAVADTDTQQEEQEAENVLPEAAEIVEEVAEASTDNKIKIDLSKVKITYIANTAEKEQEKDSVGAFKKIMAFAGKLSPGEVLADLKTKKDDLFNGGFKSKEKDSTSL